MRRSFLIAAACAAAQSALAAAPAGAGTVGEALRRPALTIAAPQRAVLLSAAHAGERLVAVGERGVIALSDDQGASWRQAPCPVSVTLTTVRFADAKHGVAVGHGGTVLTTADAGASWTVRLDGRRVAVAAQQAASTPDAQKEAARLLADGPDKPFLDLLLWDAQRMLAVGAYGLAMYSGDGGLSWSPWMARLPNPKGLHWYVAQRSGNTLLLAGEQGLLATSDDGGQSFKAQTSPYAGSWFTGDVSASGEMVLAGLRGNVWRSTDGGLHWSAFSSPVPASITASARGRDGQLLLASQAGLVLQQQGEALVPMRVAPVPLPAALLPLRDGRLLAFGTAGVMQVGPASASGAQP